MLYTTGVCESRKLSVPVIVVGNVISGGAGKTPTTIGIVLELQAKGISVGVVSRGYGRSAIACMQVQANSTPAEVGDEPLLISRATGAPVVVGANRYKAALHLLAVVPRLEVILCDDGLQHYGLYRNVEVCVFDTRGIGNGWLLPAGPLREAWPRKLVCEAGQSENSTLVLHTGVHPAFEGFRASRALAPDAVTQDGKKVNLAALAKNSGKPLLATAGIANPQAFFDLLRGLNLPLAGTLELPDHADFTAFDGTLSKQYTILCTEKDAVKLWHLCPDALAVPLVQTMEPAFFAALDRLLEQCRKAKLSSLHG